MTKISMQRMGAAAAGACGVTALLALGQPVWAEGETVVGTPPAEAVRGVEVSAEAVLREGASIRRFAPARVEELTELPTLREGRAYKVTSDGKVSVVG